MIQKRSIENLKFDGGCLCLDFTNTVHDRTASHPYEYLHTYSQLLKWIEKTQALPDNAIKSLGSLYKKEEDKAERALKDIIAAREVLYQIFAAIAEGRLSSGKVVTRFNDLLSRTLSNLDIRFTGAHTTELQWSDTANLEKPLYPIIKSAYDLLVSEKLNRVKTCGACRWLFLDHSKNNSRKWCNMQSCGSSVKAKRYYKKKKEKQDL